MVSSSAFASTISKIIVKVQTILIRTLFYNILLRTGTLVDAEVSSNLVICIVLCIASHGVFAQEQ